MQAKERVGDLHIRGSAYNRLYQLERAHLRTKEYSTQKKRGRQKTKGRKEERGKKRMKVDDEKNSYLWRELLDDN